jgi:Cu(I)-responsive transcriptional regulator
MNIGQSAAASGVSAKMIRHYETLGLVTPVRRPNGYRAYNEQHVAILQFIRHARELAFPLVEVKRLLALWNDNHRSSADVKKIALEHVASLDAKAESIRAVAESLRHLASHCAGDERPACPILEHIEAPAPRTTRARIHA